VVALFAGYEVLNVYGLLAWRREQPRLNTVKFLMLRYERQVEEIARLYAQRKRLARMLGKAITRVRALEAKQAHTTTKESN
jgi:hypothetical protein